MTDFHNLSSETLKQNSLRHHVWNRNKDVYIKKHVNKDREETTYVKIGEEEIQYIYIYQR